MSNIEVEILTNPDEPKARYFSITGVKPVKKPLEFTLEEQADQARCRLAKNLLENKKIQKIVIYFYDEIDANFVVLYTADSQVWDSATSPTGTATRSLRLPTMTFERSLLNYLQNYLQEGNPLTIEHAEKATLAQINAHLQKKKPLSITEDGGTVEAVELNEQTGELIAIFGGACEIKCPAGGSRDMTEAVIVTPLKNMFPNQIRSVRFINRTDYRPSEFGISPP